jgi:hypothetical protein
MAPEYYHDKFILARIDIQTGSNGEALPTGISGLIW